MLLDEETVAGLEADQTQGTVTLLFTDVEGSTAISSGRGDEVANEVLRAHERIVRDEVTRHDGREIKHLGDGFMVSFSSARRALACAIAIQHGVERYNGSQPDAVFRVRIGINAGDVSEREGDLFGAAVNAAARITAKAAGGEILVADVVKHLAGTMPGVSFVDRGRLRLKGFDERWRLYTVAAATEAGAPPSGGPAFVGRSRELMRLERIVALSARAGGPSAAVVVGESGVGKTALLREASRRAGVGQQLQIIGYELEQQVPLSAAGEMLRALSVLPGGERVSALLSPGAPADSELDPLRLFEAAYGCLPRDRALLVVIDDLQWVDRLSLALCQYLVRGAVADRWPLAVLAASRPSPDTAPFVHGLRSLLEETFAEISLGPLDRTDAIALARQLSPSLDDGAAERLHERAAGSPFWIKALAGGDEQDPGRVVANRLRGAPPDAAVLMTTLVLAGRPLPAFEAATVLEWEERRLDEAVRHLVNRGVVALTGEMVTVGHDLIRHAATSQVPEEQRRQTHRRLAAHLEGAGSADLPTLAAALEHRRAGGLPLGDLALRIVESPQRRLIGPEGTRRLAAIADEMDPGAESTLALQGRIAAIASDLGELTLALERWMLVSRSHPQAGERARAALAAARTAFGLQRHEEASEHLALARSLGGTDAVLAVEADVLEAILLRWGGHRLADARERTLRALDAARRLVADHSSPARARRREQTGVLRGASWAVRCSGDGAGPRPKMRSPTSWLLYPGSPRSTCVPRSRQPSSCWSAGSTPLQRSVFAA